MEGYTSYMELEAKWNSQGYVKFEPNRPGAFMCSSQLKMIYTCIVEITAYIFTKQQQIIQMTDLKKMKN